jgi:protein SCO1/2
MKKLLPALVAAIALSCSLAACDKLPGKQASFQNTDVTGLDYAKDFSLTDHTGKPRTLADYKGKVVVVFFGYTQCPDVCPTTMAEMASVMQKLGPQADQVQVLFITLDPERDTQELLAAYVPAFDKRFVGLRGTPEQTAKVGQGIQGVLLEGAGQGAGQLHHRPHGRQLRVRPRGQAAPVHPPRPAGRFDRPRPSSAIILTSALSG